MPYKPVGKTLRAQWLGQQLRKLRTDIGMTLKDVALHVDRDHSALSRYEHGEWPIRKSDVVSLLDLYGLHDPAERNRLISLAEDVWRTDHWAEAYGDIVDPSFVDYTWLEARAAEIGSYNALLLPGLLQTAEYAEAVIRRVETPDTPDPVIKRYVELRMERQKILTKNPAPWLGCIIEESALPRPIGSRAVMRQQLNWLLEQIKRPKVNIRVLPMAGREHCGLNGPFTSFVMPSPYPAVAYIENLGGRLYLETPKSQKFLDAYSGLLESALGQLESAKLIAAIAEEMR